MGKSYGCPESYITNSHFDKKDSQKEIYSKIDTIKRICSLYRRQHGHKNHNFFDYAEIRDVEDV